MLEFLVVSVDWDKALGEVDEVVGVEVELAETLLEVFEELGEGAAVSDKTLDYVHQELVDALGRLKTEWVFSGGPGTVAFLLLENVWFPLVIEGILDLCQETKSRL